MDIFLSFKDIENEGDLFRLGFHKLNLDEVRKNDYVSIPAPYKKFEFNNKFKSLKLGELIEEHKLKNDKDADVWSVTDDSGFIPSEDHFNERVFSQNTKNYKIVLPSAFAYNPSRVNVGSIAFNNSEKIGCVSPMYVVFKIFKEDELNPNYLYWLLQSEQFKEQIKAFAFGSVRQTVKFKDFCKIMIPLPSIEAQNRIVGELESCVRTIKNSQRVIKEKVKTLF